MSVSRVFCRSCTRLLNAASPAPITNGHAAPVSACHLCVGLLSTALPAISAPVQAAVSAYDGVDTFRVSVRLGAEMLIRQRLIGIENEKENITQLLHSDIASALRTSLTTALSLTPPPSPSEPADLSIQVELSVPPSSPDTALMTPSVWSSPIGEALHNTQAAQRQQSKRKRKRKRTAGLDASAEDTRPSTVMSVKGMESVWMVPPSILPSPGELSLAPLEPVVSTITLQRRPVYVGGRYRKFSRAISQSPMPRNPTGQSIPSVAEIIGKPLAELTQAEDYVLHASGREDVDVRCLIPRGRPFYVKLLNPLRTASLRSFCSTVQTSLAGSDVEVPVLVPVEEGETEVIRVGEEEKEKTYRCLVHFSDPMEPARLDGIKAPFVVNQKTPVRSMHRRAALTRPRTIHTFKPTLLTPHFAAIDMKTQAGTYIKEFVHGDLGRSSPSLAEMVGGEVDLLELDVTGISLEWPRVEGEGEGGSRGEGQLSEG